MKLAIRFAAIISLVLISATAQAAERTGTAAAREKYERSNIEIPNAQELFDSIERAGGKTWDVAFPKIDPDRYKSTEARALNLGRTAAYAALAVKARNSEALKEYIVAIKKFAQTLGIRKEVIADLARFDQLIKKEDWENLEVEIMKEDLKIRDNLLRQLRAEDEVSLSVVGGWVTAEAIAAAQIAKNYDEKQAEVLRTPQLVEQVMIIVSDLAPRYGGSILLDLQEAMGPIHKLMKAKRGMPLPAANVSGMGKQFSRLLARIENAR